MGGSSWIWTAGPLMLRRVAVGGLPVKPNLCRLGALDQPSYMYSEPAGQKTGSVRKLMPSMEMMAVAVEMCVMVTLLLVKTMVDAGVLNWEVKNRRDLICVVSKRGILG